MDDLRKAVEFAQKSMGLPCKNYVKEDISVDGLGIWLKEQYERSETIPYVENLLQYFRNKMFTTNTGDQNHVAYPGTVARIKTDAETRWAEITQTRNLGKDLDEKIKLMQGVISASAEKSQDKSTELNELGDLLGCRYLVKGEDRDLVAAISHHTDALDNHSGKVMDRITASRRILRWCAIINDWKKAAEVSILVSKLFSSVVLWRNTNADKQYILEEFGNFVSDAAAATLNAMEDAFVAIDVLESGRFILLGFMQEMRIDLDGLRKKSPILAQKFQNARDQLDKPSIKSPLPDLDRNDLRFQDQVRADEEGKHSAELTLRELLPQIRQQLGFERFLLPPTQGQIQEAAADGPIIIINVSNYRCDALVVEVNRIRIVKLPDLSEGDIRKMSKKLLSDVPEVLKWLWNAVVHPILTALGFIRPCDDQNWPRIWWIPTGILSKFPIHAAGYHSDRADNTLLDRAMSSYCFSIKGLLQSRQRPLERTSASKQVVLVAMESTLRYGPLPFANREIEKLKCVIQTSSLEPIEPKRTKDDILSHIKHCRIFHFAGHGLTHQSDPLQSCLLLDDYRADPWEESGSLTVEALFESNLHTTNPYLAYLSACGTARITSERLLDESIHLIGGCQLAGFRHVIGTLWEVNDEVCVDMAVIVYRKIMDRGMTDLSVCQGLHEASRQMRDRWLASLACDKSTPQVESYRPQTRTHNVTMAKCGRSRNAPVFARDAEITDDDEEGEIDSGNLDDSARTGPLLWVPYVHFGI